MTNLKELISHYEKALLIQPGNAKAHHRLAKIYTSQGDFERSFHQDITAIQANPTSYLPYYHLKFILLCTNHLNQSIDLDQIETAIQIVRQSVNSQSNFFLAWLLLGDLLSQQGSIEEAISCYRHVSYQKVLQSHPKLTKQYWNYQQPPKPDFVIGGLCKCGTTSLYQYLTTHPQVLTAADKEIYYFSHYLNRGLNWYLAHFPSVQDSNTYTLGEATPLYLAVANPEEVIKLFPKIKLIFLLRNPTERTISSFYQGQAIGVGQYSLEDMVAIALEQAQNLSIQEFFDSGGKLLSNYSLNQISLVHLLPSIYIYMIRKWMNVFPKEQILILKSEDLYANPSAVLSQSYRFLELPNYDLSDYQNANPGTYSRVSGDVYRKLSDFFRPYNQELETYLEMKFDWE